MIVKEVSFSRTKSFGVYENVRIGATAEVVYPGTQSQVLAELKEWVDAKISEEISKPAVEMRTEELKQIEGYIADAKKQLQELYTEIKAKRRELDRCIELGMRSLFESSDTTESWLICPHCNKLIFVHKLTQEGWSRFCPWCGEKIEEAR
jgi:hypothetical protein